MAESNKDTNEALDVDKIYSAGIEQLTEAVEAAIAVSQACVIQTTDQRKYWASILFTRLNTFAISCLTLCPTSKLNKHGICWDFGSVASLTRSIYELALTLQYLSFESISEEQWELRLLVMQLHDCTSRIRMFQLIDEQYDDLPNFEKQATELRNSLLQNTAFLTLPQTQQTLFLKGKNASVLIQDQILDTIQIDRRESRWFYEFLSSHTHSFPLGYYRMGSNAFGHGEENTVEKGYKGTAVTFAAKWIMFCTEGMKNLFSDSVDLVELKPYPLSYLPNKALELALAEQKRQRKDKSRRK